MRENVYQDLNQHLLLLQKKQIEEKVGLELEKGELERGEKLKEERERKEEKELIEEKNKYIQKFK